MKTYEPPRPGVAFAFAAAAMTALTMIAFVVLPAELEAAGGSPVVVASLASDVVQS